MKIYKKYLTVLTLTTHLLFIPLHLLAAVPQFKNVNEKTSLAKTLQGGSDHGDTRINPNAAVTFVINNKGLYAADVTNNGWIDLLIPDLRSFKLFLNEHGRFVKDNTFPYFETSSFTSAVFVDYNRDGYRDLILIPSKGRIQLLKNQGGQFTRDGVLKTPNLRAGIGAATGDYTSNGCPDLLILQYGPGFQENALKQKRFRRGAQYRALPSDNGYQNYLLKGNCETFNLVDNPAFDRRHWSLAASFFDVNQNGLLDIHVANDFYRDSLFLNQGEGEFEHIYLPHSTDRNGMSSQITDFNQDGYPDLFVSNIYLNRSSPVFNRNKFLAELTMDPLGHTALINQKPSAYKIMKTKGSAYFRDRADSLNLQKGGWGWSATWGDFTNNFQSELLLATQNHLEFHFSLNQLNLNNPEIKAFSEQYKGNKTIPGSARKKFSIYDYLKFWVGSPIFWHKTKNQKYRRTMGNTIGFDRMNPRGTVSLDYNRDGFLDVAFSQYNEEAILFENITPSEKRTNYITFKIVDPWLGGRIQLKNGTENRYIHITSRTDFSSQEPAEYHVGLDESEDLDKAIMRRQQSIDSLNNISSGSVIRVTPTNMVLEKE